MTHHYVKRHTENFEILKCPQCDKTYESKEGLKKHKDTNHSSSGALDPLFCHICKNGQKFKSKETLKKHIEIHEPKKFNKCIWCHASFSRKPYLKKHIETIHEGKKLYKCALCEIAFSQKSQLKTHTNNIHDQGMLTCHFCDKKFELLNDVNNHIQEKHPKTDDKPFKCKICDSAYSRKAYLKKHNEAHVKNS